MSSATDTTITAVRVTTTDGAVQMTAVAGLDRVVAQGAPLRVDGTTVTLEARSDRVRLEVPEGIDLVIGTTSGRVTVTGRVGSVAVSTRSGRVDIDDAAEVDIRGRSGRIHVRRCRGEARVITTSGRVVVERSGPVDVTTTSGRIVLRNVTGAARAHCATFPLAVRMGMHTGEVIERGDDVVGQTVNVAARVADLAGPGELLVTEHVVRSLEDTPAWFRPVGPVRVKGVGDRIWLHRMVR